jgi:hypothetical protein
MDAPSEAITAVAAVRMALTEPACSEIRSAHDYSKYHNRMAPIRMPGYRADPLSMSDISASTSKIDLYFSLFIRSSLTRTVINPLH